MIELDEIEEEIERLHAFISAWFRGELVNNVETFDQGFSRALADDFINIQPSGEVLTKKDLLEPIQSAFGRNPDFFIEVSQVQSRRSIGDHHCLATYLEYQRGAKNTVPADNYRRSSVLFEKADDRLIWHHIHETAVKAGYTNGRNG